MKDPFKCFVISVFLLLTFFGPAIAQTSMFRGAPGHNMPAGPALNGVFNALSWKFNAEAPIRSSIAYSTDAVYFGSSKGVFYALTKQNGAVKWMFNAGSAINSSAAFHNGMVFFTDNRQVLYSLNSASGKLIWKITLGKSKPYDWAFDYFYSSPVISNGEILVGSKDGCLYNINELTGKVNWTFITEGIVRSTPAVAASTVYFGDIEGNLYAVNLKTGKQAWKFLTTGHGLDNIKFGFDRRAIIASPVVSGNKLIVGSRDGFLYAVDKNTGKEIWRMNHEVSWVISTVAIKDTFVVTGTSDGRFIQAVNLNTGKQIWKYNCTLVWSSPIINGDKIYVGSHNGSLYCLDLKTGTRVSGFQTGAIIFSSPVISGSMLYFGSDDGYLYALRSTAASHAVKLSKYVFWEPGSNYFKYGGDVRIKQYLVDNGYAVLDKSKLVAFFKETNKARNSVVVFATNFFPGEVIKDDAHSLLRSYLGNGGKVVVLGNNPIIYAINSKDKSVYMRGFFYADTALGIKYGKYDDLRSYRGSQPAFATKIGKEWGLPKFWVAPLSLPASQVDIVLGMDENGLASAWVKKYSNAKGSGFVQIWVDEKTTDLSVITRVAEYGY